MTDKEQELREKLITLLVRLGRNYEQAQHPALLVTAHVDEILALIKEAGREKCYYCGKKPDGAMLPMGFSMAHADCVIRKLNELLDQDWENGDTKEPDKIVGYLAGYVKRSEIIAPPQKRPDLTITDE